MPGPHVLAGLNTVTGISPRALAASSSASAAAFPRPYSLIGRSGVVSSAGTEGNGPPNVQTVEQWIRCLTSRKARRAEAASSALNEIMSMAASKRSACIASSNARRSWRSPAR